MKTPQKPPRHLFENIYAFAPNREILGGTAYLIAQPGGGLLVDCPPWHPDTLNFLQAQGGVKTLYITQRAAISNQVAKIQQALGCAIAIQEQEAYLMPEATVTPFRDHWLEGDFLGLWTPGFSPGASCLYYRPLGGCLFTGRHLLPNQKGELLALRTAKTFHWGRQLRSIEKLTEYFRENPLEYLFPAANTGFLRGTGYLKGASQQLQQAIALTKTQPLLPL
ncbi:MBL fold metallo-hydrolase [Synechococcus moorigangaii CMS01]|nr:MBL fold metallo-hydrolase [Synechococcus moorigangaii CMS01]